MHIVTDYIVIVTLIYFYYRGYRKGFFKTLLGPISLIAGCFMGFAYYQRSHNIPISLGISIIGPFVITVLVSIVLKIWHRAVNDGAPLGSVSRLFGGVFSLFWGSCYLALMLILIGMIPIRFGWFEKVQDDVLGSKSHGLVKNLISKKAPAAVPDVKKITSVLEDPEKLQAFESTEEFKSLHGDEHLKELLSDEETAEQIKNKDYGKLLANPKIQEVFQNEELLRKIFALNKKIMEENPEEETESDVLEVQAK